MDFFKILFSTRFAFSLLILCSIQIQVDATVKDNKYNMDEVVVPHLVEKITGDDDRDNVELFLAIGIPNCRKETELKGKKADEKRETVWDELVSAHEHSYHACKKGTQECEQAMLNIDKILSLYIKKSARVYRIASNHSLINAAEAKAIAMLKTYNDQQSQATDSMRNNEQVAEETIEDVQVLLNIEEQQGEAGREL